MGIVRFALGLPHTFYVLAILVIFLGAVAVRLATSRTGKIVVRKISAVRGSTDISWTSRDVWFVPIPDKSRSNRIAKGAIPQSNQYDVTRPRGGWTVWN
jgi:hypothetical protein